ncbi:MAG TPA: ribosome-associated translation inhibitor RaiA [Micropepsaceae bacterium]|nr:ribosome-associated translation inhibitor RaiA [Micropepsaceae bacterium]
MMHIRVAGKQIEIGEALPQYVRERLPAAVEKHFDRDAEASVTFIKERTGFRADCTVHLSSGSSMQAHGTGQDAHKAFDMALDRLEKRVRRYKRHLKNHHDRGGQSPSEPL